MLNSAGGINFRVKDVLTKLCPGILVLAMMSGLYYTWEITSKWSVFI